MKMKNTTKKSKYLSLLLRHQPEAIGLVLDNEGWASVEELLLKINRTSFSLSFNELKEIVASNSKKRFSFSTNQTKIRANQGHSIRRIELGLEKTQAPEFLYHGTVVDFLDAIRKEGLSKMSRNHVHLSTERSTANQVGSRRGKPVILKVNARRMQREGYDFYLSDNGVWLTDFVPAAFIEFPNNTK